ncbi:MAG TPA: 23S rRNA (pseudouridine(1915)-N(3))-methyltransferase RlmH [Candidatus Saccharimonadales bacterium]|nr:23S rRNA (pseudouridine(1915)-N(3))-methyltransferase RlmH [Candidatus Saccharimonadales bacterium]
MRLTFLVVGKQHDAAIAPAINDYMRRLTKYSKPQWVIVPAPKATLTPHEQKNLETTALLAKISPASTVVLLDEHGMLLTSRDFAKELADLRGSAKDIVFVIGGAHGVGPTLQERANTVWSLSRLTFPHQLVRLVLVEQVYRACTISQGESYHHD